METRPRAYAVSIVLAAVLSACTAAVPPPAPPPPPQPAPAPAPYVEVGNASWYGHAHDGARTANGERFNMNAMTAAHRTLPFGTIVRVTNLDNQRSVRVRINDRGPHVGNRILDLSAAAARSLGIAEQGVARVRIEVVDTE
jgi:rare lipoprotein A